MRSPEKAVKALDEFFKQYPPEQYPIVEMKGSQASLRNIGNYPAFHTETIDFTNAIQEYCYLSTHDNDYQQNVLVGDNTPAKLSLPEIAKLDGDAVLTSTDKCKEISKLVGKIAQQHKETAFRQNDNIAK